MNQKINNVFSDESKFLKFIKLSIICVFVFITIFILGCLYIPFEFSSKMDIVNNLILLTKGVVICTIFYLIIKKYYKKIQRSLDGKETKILFVLSFFMLLVQLCIVYYGFFITGWDLKSIMHDAIVYANGNEATFNHVSIYFSTYPNNLLYASLLIGLIKLSNYIVGGSIEFAYFSILIIQCFISTFIGFLTYKIIYDFTKNNVISLIGWVIYFLFIGTSPWLLVGYTDSLGLFFPLTMIRLYQLYKKPENKTLDLLKYVFLIGFISYVSFRVKPQTFVTFIAICIIEFSLLFNEIITNFNKSYQNFKKILTLVFTLFISIGLSYFLVNNVIIKSSNIKIDAEREFGLSHFLMMGLDEDTNGAFSQVDYEFSRTFSTKKERTKANLEVTIERINNMKISGLTKHIIMKTSSNFSNGMFSWGGEGTFYVEGSTRDSIIAPIVKSLYYNGSGEFYGSNYLIHYEFKQMIWLLILLSLPLSVLYFKRKSNVEVLFVMLLSIIGLTIFVDLFEARGRYLFTYSPIFMILSMLGIYELIRIVDKKV